VYGKGIQPEDRLMRISQSSLSLAFFVRGGSVLSGSIDQ
jgi:hypothetical protein